MRGQLSRKERVGTRQTRGQNSAVIFEGTPVRFEVKWRLLSAKDGELIPADFFSSKSLGDDPGMVVTFRVQRVYKGNLGSEVQVHTGTGGGDCGATYATGLNYLVYGYGSSPDQLAVSMCSPGGWIGSNEVATDLRYLRRERPISAELAPILRWNDPGADKQREQAKLTAKEEHKRLTAATGRICGALTRRSAKDDFGGTVAFLSTQGYSVGEYPQALLKEDGSFCSPDLGPGKYYLYFVRRWQSPATALYYPGVTDVAKATAIEVAAGQTVSNITFKIQERSSHSVRGFVSAEQKLDFRSNVLSEVMVLLIRTDGGRAVWYSEKATFFLPKLGYFAFDDVVPGHYAACVLAPGPGWLTRKVDVNVTTHMKLISLDLVHEKNPK
jgi:hypothetical protein